MIGEGKKIYRVNRTGYETYFLKNSASSHFVHGYEIKRIGREWRIYKVKYTTDEIRQGIANNRFAQVGKIDLDVVMINAILDVVNGEDDELWK